jgi:hypothetical protein
VKNELDKDTNSGPPKDQRSGLDEEHPESETDQDPGERQKENQNEKSDDDLAA